MIDVTELTIEAVQAAPFIFANDFLRYVIGAGGIFLSVNVLFSGLLSGRRIRDRKLPEGQLRRELLTSLRTIFIFSGIGFSIWISMKFGLLRFYEDPVALGWPWFAASVVLLIVLHDAWFYWTHWLIHHPRLFRRFHRTHHKSMNPTPFTAYAFDTGEAVINGVFLLAAGAIFPISTLAVFIFTAHMMLRNAIGHCGYELFPASADGRPLFDWLTSVTHHDLHHAEVRWNYGLYFTFWDRLMGTEHPEYHERFAKAVGVDLKPSGQPAITSKALALVCAIMCNVAMWQGATSAYAQHPRGAAAMTEISGNWATQGYGAIVQLRACDERPEILCGRLVWAWDPIEFEPSAMGSLMLTDARFENGEWRDGRLRSPENGRVYSGRILQTSIDTLKLQGCAFLFCQTQVWRRLESLPHIAGLSILGADSAAE